MRVIGYLRSDFVPRGSTEEIRGFNVYLTVPVDQSVGKGVAADRVYLSQRRLDMDGIDISSLVGKEIDVIYNRNGKIAKIKLI